jgi:SRSO17 transposase
MDSEAAFAKRALTVILPARGKSSEDGAGRLLADLKTLSPRPSKLWICEQADPQLKQELGLDHFEGRSWRGLLRHALMTMIASKDNTVA